MAKEYIEKSKLISDIECIDICDCTDIGDIFIEVERTIDEQPTANVQEVVRCKDCKFFKTDTFGQKICIRQFNTIRMNDNDFCSYGEKKCGDDNA